MGLVAGTFCTWRLGVRESSPEFRQSSRGGEALPVPAPLARNPDQRRGLSARRRQASAADGVELHRGRRGRSRDGQAEPDVVLEVVAARADDDRVSGARPVDDGRRRRVTLPVLLAPTGALGLSQWRGDLAAARAAEAAGTRLVLSTASSWTIEEVAAGTHADHFFQLYPGGDETARLMERAWASGYRALFVTVDVPVIGNREGERRYGYTRRGTWTATSSSPRAMRSTWRSTRAGSWTCYGTAAARCGP